MHPKSEQINHAAPGPRGLCTAGGAILVAGLATLIAGDAAQARALSLSSHQEMARSESKLQNAVPLPVLVVGPEDPPDPLPACGATPLVGPQQLNVYSLASEDSDEEEEDWADKLEDKLLEKAGDALLGGAVSVFKDALLSEFFGSGPSLQTLSEQSLERIRDIVREEVEDLLVRFGRGEASGELSSVEALLEEYVFYVNVAECTDFALLNDVNTRSQELVDHGIFSPDTTDQYFYMADIYATAAALRIAILTERALLWGIEDTSLVRSRAGTMAERLASMLNGVNYLVSSKLHFDEGPVCPDFPSSPFCSYTVYDDFDGSARSFHRDRAGALNHYADLRSHYLDAIGGAGSHDTLEALEDLAREP